MICPLFADRQQYSDTTRSPSNRCVPNSWDQAPRFAINNPDFCAKSAPLSVLEGKPTLARASCARKIGSTLVGIIGRESPPCAPPYALPCAISHARARDISIGRPGTVDVAPVDRHVAKLWGIASNQSPLRHRHAQDRQAGRKPVDEVTFSPKTAPLSLLDFRHVSGLRKEVSFQNPYC